MPALKCLSTLPVSLASPLLRSGRLISVMLVLVRVSVVVVPCFRLFVVLAMKFPWLCTENPLSTEQPELLYPLRGQCLLKTRLMAPLGTPDDLLVTPCLPVRRRLSPRTCLCTTPRVLTDYARGRSRLRSWLPGACVELT